MSKKDYKKGMADAMEAYEAFGEKQESAIRHVGQEVEKTAQKVDKLGGKIGEITDYITDQEKAVLYKLNTPVDIADLENAEKRILLAVLYQLSADADELTEEQQNYLRAVQQYLKIYNPQTEIDLEAVENIEDISAQKAVLQTVLEFFRLGASPDELTEEQEDFLDCFQVNRRTRREISGHISSIVEAVGVKGLSEKYGFVAAQPRSEFARYKDNGAIPGDVADLCVSYIRNGYSWFQNGEYVLETRDYLVMCKAPSYRGWTTIESGDELQKYGFFRIDKHSGKVTRIDIDYKKDFSFASAGSLSFCIQGNTIYFIENCVDRDKHSEVPLVAIDFEKCSFYQLPFRFAISSYNVPVRFHISCNKMYVMIHAYQLAYYYHFSGGNEKRPLNKTFVLDLTQEGRVFVLEPDLIVRDAFLYGDAFLFLGSNGKTIALFQYDAAKKTVTDVLAEMESSGGLMRGLGGSSYLDSWVDDYEKNHIIEEIWHRENTWYFKVRSEKQYQTKRVLSVTDKMDSGSYILRNALSADDGASPITLSEGMAICCEKLGDERTPTLMRCDFLTGKKTFPDKGGRTYMLLGDYLYKLGDNGWYKTNISQGWDSLQWEIVQIQD